MSYNVRLFDLYNWNENKESKAQIMSLINEVNPDVLCIQEYYFTEDKKLAFNTRNYIIDSLGFKYYYENFSEESKKIFLYFLLLVKIIQQQLRINPKQILIENGKI